MIECAFTARLGRDAELKMVKGGSLPMLAFTAAVGDGQAADDAPATWVRCVVFGHKAEDRGGPLERLRRLAEPAQPGL